MNVLLLDNPVALNGIHGIDIVGGAYDNAVVGNFNRNQQ